MIRPSRTKQHLWSMLLALGLLAMTGPRAVADEADRTAPSVARGDSLEIRFIGNSGFELYDGQTTLLVDLPYRSGSYGSMTYDWKSVEPRGEVVCLITHKHVDHFDVRPFQRTKWKVIAPKEVTQRMPAERVIPLKLGIPVGEFVVAPYQTPHAGVENHAYVVGWKGRKIYFSGDTDDPSNILDRHDLAVAFVTPWLSCKIVEAGGSIDAQRVFLHHHHADGSDDACQDIEVMEQGEALRLGPAENYDPES